MSKEIVCKQCGYENPHTSKFCNNCGAKLPLSTHIICPNCETPNTRDRIFCDTCGTRLVIDRSPLKPEEPQESQPPVNQPFSLPVRRPGDTGELNPNAVPDWLRTGDIGSEKGEDEATPAESGKKGTADLPDWLVHDSDPDPIINAPTTISTEFFKDLLQRAEDLPQPDDLFPDEDDANLPDWLSDTNDVARGAASDEAVSSGLTDWLSDLDSSAEETAVPYEDPEDEISTGLTDWLSELDDLSHTTDTHDAANAAALDEMLNEQPTQEADSSAWLQELGPAQTDFFSSSPDNLADETLDEIPGWMDELGPIQTNLLDPSQIAELTGPLSGMADDANIFEDEETDDDISFTNLFETAGDEIETLPGWLDAAAEKGESFLTDLPDEPEDVSEPEVVSEAGSDWFTADQIVTETDLDWLSETGNLETVADDALSDLTLADEVAQDAGFVDETPDDSFDFDFDDYFNEAEAEDTTPSELLEDSDEDLGWLSDMADIETGELVLEPAPDLNETASTEPVEAAVPPPDTLDQEDAQPDDLEPEPAALDDMAWDKDGLFAETAVAEDLPDWLNRLDDKEEAAESADLDAANEEMPDWIASMRPSEGFLGSELPGILSDMDIRDTLEGIPEELAGAELPDWLQDTPLDSPPPMPFFEPGQDASLEIPDWLQPDDAEADTAVTPKKPAPESPGSGRSEWRSLLNELPPLTPLAESLPKADIPEWVQHLKPPELSGQPPREPEGPAETVGPLKGLHGIVTIEPTIARPRMASPLQAYVTTPEQQQQAALLRQITQAMPATATTLSRKTAYDTAVWLRIALALLLMGALLVGLRGPSLVATEGQVPAHVQAVEAAVSAAAGQPVLVAVEYTPAMAGELSPQAEMLLAQLAANGSPVLITSQYAAGTAVANSLQAEGERHMLGYLPGESIGLRQLGDCLAGRNSCDQLNGRLLDADLQASLDQVSLVIVLTGDRDNLVNWVEQVGSVAPHVVLVAGVTQALTPLTRSYAATGQISGLLGGIPDAVVYEQLIGQPASDLHAQLNAQIVGQLLAAGLLAIGLLAYGTTSLVNRRQDKD